MPTLIPYAKPAGPHCLQALPHLRLPQLSALLQCLTADGRQTCAEDSLTPLPELLQAQALGLQPQDGLVPWAALAAHTLQLPPAAAGHGWAWLTPCHWQVNADHVRMADPADTLLGETDSRAFMESMRGFFAEDGIALQAWHKGHWLAVGAAFADLPTASLARASGGAVDHWMPRQAQARPLRRLQNEMQMLLYQHPLNDARSAAGLLPITSFWVSATGRLPANFQPLAPAEQGLCDALQAAALRDDASAWTQAWQALDEQVMGALLQQARLGQPVHLTLCAENAAQSYRLQPQSLWARLRMRLDAMRATKAARATTVLQAL